MDFNEDSKKTPSKKMTSSDRPLTSIFGTALAHLAVRLELGKDSLLRPPSFVEENDLAWIGHVVGHDDLELVSIFDGLKQIELNGSFVLASDVFSDEDEAIAAYSGAK